MSLIALLISLFLSATGVAITEPVDGETYDGDWLTVRAIVENENEIPDSVHYSINGQPVLQIPRLNTDWYTYMANDLHTGYSESPAPADNTILWTAPVTGDTHEFPSPVIVNGIVYYPSNSGTDSLYALDAATGELIWKYRIGYTDDAVTVKDGYLYVASDSLWCLDALAGERIWATAAANVGGSTPAVVEGGVYAGRATFISGKYYSYVHRFDTVTGTEVWTDTLSGLAASCQTVWNGMVFIPTYTGPLYALDAATGSIIWENTDAYGGYWDSSPVVVDGVIYINDFDGKTRGIAVATGSTIWEVDITAGVNYLAATPAYNGGRLYFADQVHTYHCLDAATGSTIWSVPGFQHGSSGIAHGIVFYGEGIDWYDDNSSVIALNCETGEEIWSYETGNTKIYSSPAITDGVVYIAGMDWNLYAFGTGLKYTYLDDLFAQVGSNELIVTSFNGGVAVAADTISFAVTQTGITLEPSESFNLAAKPNPFHASATIFFELSQPGFTSLEVYDLSGRKVVCLISSDMPVGTDSIQWNGCSESGELVSSGLYLCRIESGGLIETTGLCLLK